MRVAQETPLLFELYAVSEILSRLVSCKIARLQPGEEQRKYGLYGSIRRSRDSAVYLAKRVIKTNIIAPG